METNNIDLFEAYLNGTLSQEEQVQVESRLRTDDDFKQDYELYQLMVTAIAENRKAELKTYISKNVKIKPVQFFRTPTFYAAAAASVLLCVLSYFVIYKKLSEQKELAESTDKQPTIQQPVSTPNDSIQSTPAVGNTNQNIPPATTNSNGQNPASKIPTVTDNNSFSSEMLDSHDNDSKGSEVSDLSNKPDDIKVESDKMMSDSFLQIPRKIFIPKPKQYQTSPTDLYAVVVAGDKLKLEVQFWESPINYNGYKLNKNLLLIYGKFDPSQATFQELKDVIYMKYKNDFYKFLPGETFSSMRKETDAKVIGYLTVDN